MPALFCRLDHLRTMVPDADRSNTANVLELAIAYIAKLQDRIERLEGRPLPEAAARRERERAQTGIGATSAASDQTNSGAQTPVRDPSAAHLGRDLRSL